VSRVTAHDAVREVAGGMKRPSDNSGAGTEATIMSKRMRTLDDVDTTAVGFAKRGLARIEQMRAGMPTLLQEVRWWGGGEILRE
jgi:hypothetical protein